MTETEWRTCDDPEAMLAFLGTTADDGWGLSCACCCNDCVSRAGVCPAYRKLRLFACACARRVLHLLDNPSGQRAIEAAELYAERQLGEEETVNAANEFDAIRRGRFPKMSTPDDEAWNAVYCALHRKWESYYNTRALERWELAAAVSRDATTVVGPEEAAAHAALLRDVIGIPFRRAHVDRSWLTADVVALAWAAHDERIAPDETLDRARLAILADALEEMGCAGDFVGHLREEGPHVRGCWTLDLILGKE